MRACAGTQPPGRALPNFVPEGLGIDAHLAVARVTVHPLARQLSAPLDCNRALDARPICARSLVARRAKVSAILDDLAAAYEPLLWSRMCLSLWKCVLLPAPTTTICGATLCPGCRCTVGRAHSSTSNQRPSRPPGTEWDANVTDKANSSVLHRVMSIGDQTTDTMAWDKILAEFANGSMQGPYYSLDELPAGQKRLVPRFPWLERHGGAKVDSCRVIDDCKITNINNESGNTPAHRPIDLDQWCVLIRMVCQRFVAKMMGFTLDFKGAYRQIASCPAQMLMFIIVAWGPVRDCVCFRTSNCQVFGSGNSPFNFCRYPDWFCRQVCCLFALACSHCVDDILFIDRVSTSHSGYRAWRNFAASCDGTSPTLSRLHLILFSARLAPTPTSLPSQTVLFFFALRLPGSTR